MTKAQDLEKKVVLLIEDNPTIGQNIADGFEDRGFTAHHVTSPNDAFKLLERLDQPPDVTILDMNLEADQSGADVGMAILKKFREDAPEFIIYSAYNNKRYYRAAFDLGAGIYLSKADDDYRVVITNARILAIRRAIRNYSLEIGKIVTNCNNIGEAMERCITEFLLPQLQLCLGANHFMLFSEFGVLKILGDQGGLIENHPIWREIQNEVFRGNELVVPVDRLDTPLTWPDESLRQQLQNAMIIPLYRGGGFKIALFIEDDVYEDGSLKERAQPLAEALARHLRLAIVENFFQTIHVLAGHQISIREQAQATARFCSYVGERQKELYNLAKRADEIRPGALILPGLKTLSRELHIIGNQMQILDTENELEKVSFKELVITEWEDLVADKQAPKGMLDADSLEDDWLVLANRGSLSLGIKRILVWMINRQDKYPEGKTPRILVEPGSYESGFCSVTFRDYSDRLPEQMLRNLFKPFSGRGKQVEDQLGLFQAKMLVEVANDGRLWERPQEMSGHTLEMQLQTP